MSAKPSIVVAYGSTYGDTADAAERIAAALTERAATEPAVRDIAHSAVHELAAFDVLLLGCSTWNVGELQSDWASKADELGKLDLRGKRVALFGSGDQVGYPDTYMDALGHLAERVEARGAELAGSWPAVGYHHTASLAQRGGRFVGLALDATNQHERTRSRIERWVLQLTDELALWSARRAERGAIAPP